MASGLTSKKSENARLALLTMIAGSFLLVTAPGLLFAQEVRGARPIPPQTAGGDQESRVLPRAPELVLDAHPAAEVRSIAFSTDGGLIATLGSDKKLKIWSLSDGKSRAEFPADPSRGNRPGFTPEGKLVVYLESPTRIAARAPEAGADARLISWPEPGEATCIDVAPGGRSVVAAVGTHVMVWKIADGQRIGALEPHGAARVRWAAVSPEGARVATVGDDGRLVVSDVSSMKSTFELKPDSAPVRVSWSPLGVALLLENAQGRVLSVELKRSQGTPIVDLPTADSPLEFSPLGMGLGAGWNDGRVRTWERVRGMWLDAPLVTGTSPITALRFSWNGAKIAAGDTTGTVRVWRLEPEATE